MNEEMTDSQLAATLSRAKGVIKRIQNRIAADSHDVSILQENCNRLQEEVNRRLGHRENPPA